MVMSDIDRLCWAVASFKLRSKMVHTISIRNKVHDGEKMQRKFLHRVRLWTVAPGEICCKDEWLCIIDIYACKIINYNIQNREQ